MAFENEELNEKGTSSSAPTAPKMTLQQATDLGEYKPEFLATFPEWHTYSAHASFNILEKR